jgi:hypothetical protein
MPRLQQTYAMDIGIWSAYMWKEIISNQWLTDWDKYLIISNHQDLVPWQLWQASQLARWPRAASRLGQWLQRLLWLHLWWRWVGHCGTSNPRFGSRRGAVRFFLFCSWYNPTNFFLYALLSSHLLPSRKERDGGKRCYATGVGLSVVVFCIM